jgi:hypothetical protein
MRKIALGLTLALVLPVWANPPVIDGSATDVLYGTPLVVQDTLTQFGNSNLGRPDIANGSEMDSAYGVVYQGTLYLVLAGNFESNGNKFEIFFDTRAGGQNRLLATNPGTPNVGLLRMSEDPNDPNLPGLTFQTGFEADFWVSFNVFGNPPSIYVDYAELYVSPANPGVLYYCGAGLTKCATVGGQLMGGDPNAPQVLMTVDNSNVAGVDGGTGAGDGSNVFTGAEFAIPLSAIGNPAGSFTITAFVNGQQHDFVSNQVLGGLSGLTTDNLGEPRIVNFQTVAFGVQTPFTVPTAPTPTGACCKTGACTIKTNAQCTTSGGVYQGDNSNCDGNPCDATPAGRCCKDDGYSGQCLVLTQAQCTSQGGTYGGNGTTCEACPCLLPPKGACCVSGACQLQTQTQCAALSGVYVGDYTNCTTNPCDEGACCTGIDCAISVRFLCTGSGVRFLGAGTTCTPGVCNYTIETPYVAGDFNGWNAGDPNYAMTETPAGSHIYVKVITGLAPGSRHEFKITRGDWSVNLPIDNSWLIADGAGGITITYDANYITDGWMPPKDRLNLSVDPGQWTGVGDWQDGLPGYAPGDWNNADPNTAMTPLGGGLYQFTRSGLAAGTYAGKATRTGTWDAIGNDNRSVDPDNISFVIAALGDTLSIEVDAFIGRIRIVVTPAGPAVCRGDLNCDGIIDFDDINPFVLALSNFGAWQTTYGSLSPLHCSDANADCNADTLVDFDDINSFVAFLSASATCPNP